MYVLTEVNDFYNRYFDIPEGKDNSRFENNENKFIISFKSCFVDNVDHISSEETRIRFYFFGSKCKCSIINGEEALFNMEARFVGTILCNDIVSIEKEEKINLDSENTIFGIKKSFWGGKKIISIQNQKVGKIVITCKKLYAESLDCYFKHYGEWVKEKI